jgi:hypothetical protein
MSKTIRITVTQVYEKIVEDYALAEDVVLADETYADLDKTDYVPEVIQTWPIATAEDGAKVDVYDYANDRTSLEAVGYEKVEEKVESQVVEVPE